MKSLKAKYLLGLLVLSSLILNVLSSCSEEQDNTTPGPLRIDSVSLTGHNLVDGVYVPKDSLTEVGYSGNLYIVRGSGFSQTQKIFFNDFEADFNPTLVTDNTIIVAVPVGTPYVDVSNKLRIVTLKGEAEYDFVIGQPSPKITSFDPVAGSAGDIVTIKGEVFDNLIGVKFDDAEAVVISSTSTEIKVEIPAGVVQAKIYVETAGGVAESPGSFGFKRIIYDDALGDGFQLWGGWGGTQELQSTEVVKRGTYAIKRVTDPWSALQIGYAGSTLNLGTDVTAVKVSIYAENTGKVKIVFNSDDAHGKVIDVVGGQWTDFTIPVSEITPQTTFSQLWLQEFAGSANVLYIDDFGFI